MPISQSPRSKILYLHGFASGPSSYKATYISDRLRKSGLDVSVPDLNQPSFSQMTITSQLACVNEAAEKFAAECSIVMFGSSMGGLLSVLHAAKDKRVKALILMAPGFGLPRRWATLLGKDEFARWKETGKLSVFHHAYNQNVDLHHKFIEDAESYCTEGLKVYVPTLVFHGIHDETVPKEESEQFAALNQGNVDLRLLNDNHELMASIDQIWESAKSFLVRNLFFSQK